MQKCALQWLVQHPCFCVWATQHFSPGDLKNNKNFKTFPSCHTQFYNFDNVVIVIDQLLSSKWISATPWQLLVYYGCKSAINILKEGSQESSLTCTFSLTKYFLLIMSIELRLTRNLNLMGERERPEYIEKQWSLTADLCFTVSPTLPSVSIEQQSQG